MFRLLIILALSLFMFAACQDTTSNSSSMPDGDTTTQQPIAPMGNAVAGEIKGEHYVVKTIDGEIKSPRMELEGKVGDVPVTINYGSPAVNDRTIYGDLVPYEKVWRTGANEATRITFDQPVKVGAEGKELQPGTYALFTLPAAKDNWTIIFNKKADQWGAYDYDEKDDVVKVKGSAKETSANAERMNFAVEGNEIKLMWADLVVSFPVQAAAK